LTTRLCGAGMAFLGFGVSLLIGLSVGNTFVTVVTRGLVVLFLFYLLGYVLAGLGQKVVIENFDAEAESLQNDAQANPDTSADNEQQPENPPPPSENQTQPPR